MPIFNHIIIFWHIRKDGLMAPWHYLSDSTPTQFKKNSVNFRNNFRGIHKLRNFLKLCFIPTMPNDPSSGKELLFKLNTLIKKLPTTLPCGSNDGSLAKYLTSLKYDNDSPYKTFNPSWECVFQCADAERKLVVVWGKYGLDLAHRYATHFATVAGIENNNGLGLVAQRLKALIELTDTTMWASPQW